MNVLFIGDISGKTGREAVHSFLYDLKEKYAVDFCIANGENAAGGSGMTREVYDELSRAGIDFFTMGNHVWSKKEIVSLMEEGENIVRPANFPKGTPGEGYAIARDRSGRKIGIINLMGRVYLDNNLDNPFLCIKPIVEKIREITPIILVDFHGEATSEKIAMGWYLDGLVSAVLGTHTHVQTNDDRILPKGTAYLTDAGMTGAKDSVLGIEKEIAIYKFLTAMPKRHVIAEGEGQLCGVFLQIDDKTGKTLKIEKIRS